MLLLNSVSEDLRYADILRSVTATFPKGITTIAGPNGCGKSTLLKVICGLLPLKSGTISYDGKTIRTEEQAWRNLLGYLPQSSPVYDRMSVAEFLDYMLLLSSFRDRAVRKHRIEMVAVMFGLTDYLTVRCGVLSGGVRQRVGVAQALVHDPKILLLDEPANNLDVESSEQLELLLLELRKEKIIIQVTHQLNNAYRYSDQFVFMKKGVIVHSGKPGSGDLLPAGAPADAQMVQYKQFTA